MFWVTIIVLVALDQLTKMLVVYNIPFGSSVPFLGNFMQLTYVQNTGASFSILEGQRIFFIIATVLVLTVVAIVHFKFAIKNRAFQYTLAVFFGGTMGNFIDRLRIGAVIDFFDLGWFPIFNIADSCIVLSVIALCVMILFGEAGRELNKKKTVENNAGN